MPARLTRLKSQASDSGSRPAGRLVCESDWADLEPKGQALLAATAPPVSGSCYVCMNLPGLFRDPMPLPQLVKHSRKRLLRDAGVAQDSSEGVGAVLPVPEKGRRKNRPILACLDPYLVTPTLTLGRLEPECIPQDPFHVSRMCGGQTPRHTPAVGEAEPTGGPQLRSESAVASIPLAESPRRSSPRAGGALDPRGRHRAEQFQTLLWHRSR